jgi:energy-coupling factor transporter ATP-binding protein EcfA2
LVLQAVLDIQGDSPAYIEDRTVAQQARMDLDDVRNCFVVLEERGFLNVALLINGKSASITHDGRLELRRWEASPGGESRPAAHHPGVAVRPKGLLSFDHRDADFFLQLLPGPRNKDGLPDSVLYWKSRIETTDAEQTFRVGVIYGPSGCGKSSLVKAGLLPNLGKHICWVYVEATPDLMESRLVNALRRRHPRLTANLGLDEALLTIRNSEAEAPGKKTLLVIDQFEQWLAANKIQRNPDLVTALRHCDGERLQAIVIIRDDFWLAVHHFMNNVGVELRESRNFAAIDLFDLRHAARVLTVFGQALEALPNDLIQMTREQQDFLGQASAALAQDGKVAAIRLALFADTIKSKAWIPQTMREMGGAVGVGIAFLEEKLNSRRTNPVVRQHQMAVLSMLHALLPEDRGEIRGCRKSRKELLEASGYVDREEAFDEVLQVLESEIRLLTLIDVEGLLFGETAPQGIETGEAYYQLAHDYLVPSVRKWLARSQHYQVPTVAQATQCPVVPKGLRSYDESDADFFLYLLPGPRDKNGLPESVRFWKYRIENRKGTTFTVGVIFGPSGCGKSSLVKAGILPNLAEHVLTVYLEATADGTENGLLAGIRNQCPGLFDNSGLVETVQALSRGEGLGQGYRTTRAGIPWRTCNR